jgi:hypothetical protein
VPAAIDVGKRLTPTLYLTEAWLPEVCSKTAQKENWGIPQTNRVKRKLSTSIFFSPSRRSFQKSIPL